MDDRQWAEFGRLQTRTQAVMAALILFIVLIVIGFQVQRGGDIAVLRHEIVEVGKVVRRIDGRMIREAQEARIKAAREGRQ